MRPWLFCAFLLLMFQAFFIFAPLIILGGAINWPESLDYPPSQILPLIHERAGEVRLGYGLYLLWSLAFAGSAALIVAFARGARAWSALASLALAFGAVSALARAIGIVRWLTGSAALSEAYAAAPAGGAERVAIEATQLALNAYGGSIGEDLGVGVFASLWLASVGALILRDRGLPNWLGWLAFPAAFIGAAPSLAIVGVQTPVNTTIATTAVLLWIAAAGLVLLVRSFKRGD